MARLTQKDLYKGKHVYMVGIEGITSLTIIEPNVEGMYNLGPKFTYINHRHGDIEDCSYHEDQNSLDIPKEQYNDRGLYETWSEAKEALEYCKKNYEVPKIPFET